MRGAPSNGTEEHPIQSDTFGSIGQFDNNGYVKSAYVHGTFAGYDSGAIGFLAHTLVLGESERVLDRLDPDAHAVRNVVELHAVELQRRDVADLCRRPALRSRFRARQFGPEPLDFLFKLGDPLQSLSFAAPIGLGADENAGLPDSAVGVDGIGNFLGDAKRFCVPLPRDHARFLHVSSSTLSADKRAVMQNIPDLDDGSDVAANQACDDTETEMQKLDSKIGCGSRLVFWRYWDEAKMAMEDRIFAPGQFLVVGAINPDGGLQCYPTDEDGTLVSYDGDTLFEEEIVHLSYAHRLDVSTLR